MKKFNLKFLLYTIPLLLLTACSKEDPKPEVDPPKANFSYVIDGKTVKFTNSSTGASTYAWDFGDGQSSTEASPSVTYAQNGSYIAKLTVTNSAGSDSKQEVLDIINVSIDGDFSDWESVTTVIPGTGKVKQIKVENLENNTLFLYVEGTEDMATLTQIMLDLDNDKSTGAMIDWRYFESGEDVMLEGNLAEIGDDRYGEVYPCSPCDGSNPGGWNWGEASLTDITAFCKASELKSIPGGVAYELSIDLTAMGQTISSDAIGVAYMSLDTDTWDTNGFAPAPYNENDNPEGTLYSHPLK